MADLDDRRVDVIIVGGQLGAGKTSFLRRLLSHVDPASTGLLVNEAAASGIDQFTLKMPGFAMEDLFGCICCRPAEDTVSALMRMKESRNDGTLERVIIETSGLASTDLLVADLLADYRFLRRFEIAAVLAVVDGSLDYETLVALATDGQQQTDLVLVSHLNTLPAHQVPQRFAQVKSLYARSIVAPCLVMTNNDVGAIIDCLPQLPRRSPATRLEQMDRASAQRVGGHGSQARYFELPVSLDAAQCLEFGQALSMFGPSLQRFKMLSADPAGHGTLLLNVTEGRFQALERLEIALDGDARIFYVSDGMIFESVENFLLAQIIDRE